MSDLPPHIVAVFGSGVAGAEAVSQLTRSGIRSVVFEKGLLPWGKIELGLPKWHAKQRDQEESTIDEALAHDLVRFVPGVKLGCDLALNEVRDWGFSAVLLALGAWKDRPLAVPGIDALEGRGFYYQNPLVAWFNQCHDPAYSGPTFELFDGAAVIGGGLASIDVAKILMFRTTQDALAERGLTADLFSLEKKGIPKTLETLGLAWSDLGLRGCTLYYRRRAQDMPLIPLEESPDPSRLAQAARTREKMMDNFRAKYLFQFQPCTLPVEAVVEGGRLAGLRMRRTEVTPEGRVRELAESDFEIRTPLVVSSIGSIPEPVPGIPMDRELYDLEDERTGQLSGFDNVFALGNAVTGRGNIRASRIHGREVSRWLIGEFLAARPAPTRDVIRAIDERVTTLQTVTGFDGSYRKWVASRHPVRLEAE